MEQTLKVLWDVRDFQQRSELLSKATGKDAWEQFKLAYESFYHISARDGGLILGRLFADLYKVRNAKLLEEMVMDTEFANDDSKEALAQFMKGMFGDFGIKVS